MLGLTWEWAAGAGTVVPGGWIVAMVDAAAGVEWLGVRVVVCGAGFVGLVVVSVTLGT